MSRETTKAVADYIKAECGELSAYITYDAGGEVGKEFGEHWADTHHIVTPMYATFSPAVGIDAVVMVGVGFTVSVKVRRVCVGVGVALSLTVTAIVTGPARVGVPDSTPVAGLRVSPSGTPANDGAAAAGADHV